MTVLNQTLRSVSLWLHWWENFRNALKLEIDLISLWVRTRTRTRVHWLYNLNVAWNCAWLYELLLCVGKVNELDSLLIMEQKKRWTDQSRWCWKTGYVNCWLQLNQFYFISSAQPYHHCSHPKWQLLLSICRNFVPNALQHRQHRPWLARFVQKHPTRSKEKKLMRKSMKMIDWKSVSGGVQHGCNSETERNGFISST